MSVGFIPKIRLVSIAGTWCFISSEYAISRLLLHYVPVRRLKKLIKIVLLSLLSQLFIASGLIVVLYGLVFLVLRGTISFTQNVPHSSALPLNDMFARQRVMIAKRMLWYPIGRLFMNPRKIKLISSASLPHRHPSDCRHSHHRPQGS